RLGSNLDYDALHEFANNHIILRNLMRISRLYHYTLLCSIVNEMLARAVLRHESDTEGGGRTTSLEERYT
ncbi:MAG: hypothetical protein KAV83_13520, partial [Desulfobacterales bacterium]|nr:hypothetical protein [Desulfobacterales bacterium]